MAKGGIKINLKGFDKVLENIKTAGGDVDQAAERALTASAKIVETELRKEATAKGVPIDVTKEIRTRTSESGDRYEAEVGWSMDGYNPQKPSAGYKAVFLNYGTVRRTTRKGYNRGEIHKPSRSGQFIYTAKRKSQKKVKEAQAKILERVMRDLKK